jgi:hypothetical protein
MLTDNLVRVLEKASLSKMLGPLFACPVEPEPIANDEPGPTVVTDAAD